LANLRVDDFRDDELDLPYYLAHFRELADAVAAEGPNRGYFNLPVWRRPADNRPYNARVMENILSLVWFYTADRPWNPYRGSAAVREKIEAALEFWLGAQRADGKFSEYNAQNFNLAATGFATELIGRALVLLASGPAIEAGLHRRAIEAIRRALRAGLTDVDFYEHGRSFSNQYSSLFAGALQFLQIADDPELAKILRSRMEQAHAEHQSPAGFYYEANGPDWIYNVHTHSMNLRVIWHYLRNDREAQILIDEERRWYDWLSWNAVPEPDWSGFHLNRVIETRTHLGWLPSKDCPLGTHIELARAFSPTIEERRAEAAALRKAVRADGFRVPPLSEYSPEAFLTRGLFGWYPSERLRAKARQKLPPIANTRLTHQIADSRVGTVFTYVRRPGYYAAFNSGARSRESQQLGLGLLWAEATGAMLQSRHGVQGGWGTQADGAPQLYEANDLRARYTIGRERVQPRAGTAELGTERLEIYYPLATAGEKTVSFNESDIAVTVRHEGAFVEHIPLLLRGSERAESVEKGILVRGSKGRLLVCIQGDATLSVENLGESVGPARVVSVCAAARHQLEYRFIAS
jgi:hypothetical protein